VNVAVEFPAAVGIPLTTPVPALRSTPAGRTPPDRVHVNGTVPPVTTSVEVYPFPTTPKLAEVVDTAKVDALPPPPPPPLLVQLKSPNPRAMIDSTDAMDFMRDIFLRVPL
jgi:hypothetical protein